MTNNPNKGIDNTKTLYLQAVNNKKHGYDFNHWRLRADWDRTD